MSTTWPEKQTPGEENERGGVGEAHCRHLWAWMERALRFSATRA
jgi:hypothetical protein